MVAISVLGKKRKNLRMQKWKKKWGSSICKPLFLVFYESRVDRLFDIFGADWVINLFRKKANVTSHKSEFAIFMLILKFITSIGWTKKKLLEIKRKEQQIFNPTPSNSKRLLAFLMTSWSAEYSDLFFLPF